MALYDLGLVKDEEPFENLLTQGMVIKDGAKMSKSSEMLFYLQIIEKYGADTARLFILSSSPPDRELDWSDKGVESFRFLNRIWRLAYEFTEKHNTEAAEYEINNDTDKNLPILSNSTHD